MRTLPRADKLKDEHSKVLRPLVVAAFIFGSSRFSRTIQQLQFGLADAASPPRQHSKWPSHLVIVPEFALSRIVEFLQHESALAARLMFRAVGVLATQDGVMVYIPGLDIEVAHDAAKN